MGTRPPPPIPPQYRTNKMGLFSRKPKARLDEFCREFYDTYLLHPKVAGVDVVLTPCETAKPQIGFSQMKRGRKV